MKKQILTLTFFTLAIIFAGMKSNAQLVDTPQLDGAVTTCPTPSTLSCGTPGALSPLPGEIYTYDIEVTAGSTIHWFVTTDTNVIDPTNGLTTNREAIGGTYVLNAGTTGAGGNASYNDGANTGDILEVSWNYFDPTGPAVLLVAYAENAAGCTDNVEVYRILPVFNFTLDIAALEDDGNVQDASNPLECVSPVQNATYDGTNLVMDYGDNYIFYIVTAANWVTSWLPSFNAPTSAGGSTVGTVEWTYADDANDAAATWYTDTDPVEASHWGVSSVGSSGQCIVLRVNIDHDNVNEMIAAETYTMGVNGLMYNSATSTHDMADLDDDGSGGCINSVTDEADYIITPRPDINAETPAPFVPKN